MKNALLTAIISILTISGTALADAKIKTKQTVGGQSSENTTYIKGKRQRTEMGNGMLVSITQCDLSRDLQLAPTTKTYTISNYDDGTGANTGTPTSANGVVKAGGTMYITTTTRDTGERKQMFGYTARHIIQTIEMEAGPDSCSPNKTKMEMDMWVIDAEFGIACTQNRNYTPNYGKAGGCRDKIVSKNLGTGKTGYPLYQKMTMFDANGKESTSMTQEVVELSKAALDASLFEVPADYREVKDSSHLYTSAAASSSVNYSGSSSPIGSYNGNSSSTNSSISNAARQNSDVSTNVGAKQVGSVRIGLVVKTGAVGEGIAAADLAAAVQNTLGQYLKGTKTEVVPLEAKLASAQAEEAKQKECDQILTITASHKKGGGGGFGFGKMLGSVVSQTGIGHTGSTVGNIAGQVATQTIVSATSMSGNIKSKDEITLDLAMNATGGSSTLAKQFKAKAKSNGDDIISAAIEQAAQAILDAVK
ncbi:MAG TPA: DUF4412 domain-containing protein [Pyrinomonadaceae bacterium]|nr:DUF4412 domain-containing protein [Pyrinomonadaceae bacterium]